jgi:hypothetical protein
VNVVIITIIRLFMAYHQKKGKEDKNKERKKGSSWPTTKRREKKTKIKKERVHFL